MVGRVNTNLSVYLPELLPTLSEYMQKKDAEKANEILLQLVTAFSPEQKAALFKEIRRGNVPDPLKRLDLLTKKLGEGEISTAEFLKQAEKTITSTRTIDGKTVKLPSPAERLTKMNEAIMDGRLSDKELEMYTQLKSVENVGGGPNEAGLTTADRFLDEAMKSKKGNNDVEKIKLMATAAVEAESIEDSQDGLLFQAAAGESVTQAFEDYRAGDRTEGGSRTRSGGSASREEAGGTGGSGGSGHTSSSSSASRSSGGTGGSSGSGRTSSSRSAATGTGGEFVPSGMSGPGGKGGGIDVGDVTSIDLSPTEQQLYNKLKAEDPQAAARFFLQQKLAKISEMAAMLSNIAKMRHDSAMAIIGNMR